MKKFLILTAFLFLSACSQEPAQPISQQIENEAPVAAPWQENIHYMVLDQPASKTPIVQEFFSFWCPHCYNFEPIVAQIKAQLDSDTPFEKIHVDFMGITSQNIQQAASQAMIMGRSMGIEEAINSAIFNYIHVDRKDVGGMADMKPFFLANQISEQAFNDALNSPEVNTLVAQHNATFTQYEGNIKSVPTLVVNGKYMATFTRDMSVNDMVSLIVWLSDK